MNDQVRRWPYIVRLICCFWIAGLRHMDRYLLVPRGMESDFANYITYGLLSVVFFTFGMYAWGGYRSRLDLSEKQYAILWIKGKAKKHYPLFFLSLASIYLASLVVGNVHISFLNFIGTSAGLAWLFSPMIPTLCFCSILIFFEILTFLMALISKQAVRNAIVLIVYMFLLVIIQLYQLDNHFLLFYALYFLNEIVDTRFLMITRGKKNKSINGDKCSNIKNVIYRILEIAYYPSFCVYLFHRQFFEFEIMVFGRLSITASWISLVLLYFISLLLQKLYDLTVNNSELRF